MGPGKSDIFVGSHNSTYSGGTTALKPIYFRQYIKLYTTPLNQRSARGSGPATLWFQRYVFLTEISTPRKFQHPEDFTPWKFRIPPVIFAHMFLAGKICDAPRHHQSPLRRSRWHFGGTTSSSWVFLAATWGEGSRPTACKAQLSRSECVACHLLETRISPPKVCLSRWFSLRPVWWDMVFRSLEGLSNLCFLLAVWSEDAIFCSTWRIISQDLDTWWITTVILSPVSRVDPVINAL